MEQPIRINLVISPSREGVLYDHLNSLPVDDRASVFKYLAFSGYLLTKGASIKPEEAAPKSGSKPPGKKNSGNKGEGKGGLASTAQSDNQVAYKDHLDANDLGVNF